MKLSTPAAILIAGLLVALAITAHLMVDRFELVSGGLTIEGYPAIWRLNVRNGHVTPCVLLPDPTPPNPLPTGKYYVRCRD